MPIDERLNPLRLTAEEEADVRRRARPRAAILHEAIRFEGELELRRPASGLAWSGLAAGLSMGFSLVTQGIIWAAVPDVPWRPLLSSFGYCVGFLVVVMGRQQLFTENTLTPVLSLLQKRDRATLVLLLRLWAIVLATNLLGVSLFALVLAHTDAFTTTAKHAFEEIGLAAMAGGFQSHGIRAVFSGWLIALMVWMLPGADTARAMVIVFVTYIVGLGRLSHSIAGSVEVLYAVMDGSVSVGHYLADFLVPVLAGNVVGGVAFVAALNHAQVASGGK